MPTSRGVVFYLFSLATISSVATTINTTTTIANAVTNDIVANTTMVIATCTSIYKTGIDGVSTYLTVHCI